MRKSRRSKQGPLRGPGRSRVEVPNVTAASDSVPVAMTVAGSDSGGGAGIQADLKAFASLGVFGTSALTCITAQNPGVVDGIEPVTPEMVAQQIRTVCDAFPVLAAKTGMLFSAEIIAAVAAVLESVAIENVVVDPVMVATSGARLLQDDAIGMLQERMLPLASVITPNLPEAAILCGHEIASLDGMREAARDIGERFQAACVVKGGHFETSGDVLVDVLFVEGKHIEFSAARIPKADTHGTGCTFAAALAAWLAKGAALNDAVGRAQAYVIDALRSSVLTGRYRALGWTSG